MEAQITEFAGLLRRSGIRVSIAETLDAIAAVRVAGVADGTAFRDALRASMVKRSADLGLFETLFDLHFRGLPELISRSSRAVRERLSMSEAEFAGLVERVKRMLADFDRGVTELLEALLTGRNDRLERLIRDAFDQINRAGSTAAADEGDMIRSMARVLGLDWLDEELGGLRKWLAASTQDEDARLFDLYGSERRRSLEDLIRRYIRMEHARRRGALRAESNAGSLGERSFFYLTEQEMAQMSDAVTRMARQLRRALTVRRKRGKRGRFDIKRTLRINLKNGGDPYVLRFEQRRRDRPEIVILCDVSDSVRNASRFMLQFVYALQDLYSRVRSFIFVAEIGEVTRQFRKEEPARALDTALRGDIINVHAHSNFGRAFRTFANEHLDAVNRRTTVVVLGDARNNYNPPHDQALHEIRRRAERLIWLNPESRNTWGFGDSEMERYAIHCNLVEECRNLNQLYRVIDRLSRR
jgi:uncharacterized protein with von Willebrand factor type A (vWA) domain